MTPIKSVMDEIFAVSSFVRSSWRATIRSLRSSKRRTGKIESCFTVKMPAEAEAVSVIIRKTDTTNIDNAILGSCMILILFSMILEKVEPKRIVARSMTPAVIPVATRVIERAIGTMSPILGNPSMCLTTAMSVARTGRIRIR